MKVEKITRFNIGNKKHNGIDNIKNISVEGKNII
jgi:hypothetical protein